MRAGQAGLGLEGHGEGRSCPVVLTGPLCAGELSRHDPGEGSDGSQGPYVQERCCALVWEGTRGTADAQPCQTLWSPTSRWPISIHGAATLSRRKLGVWGLWTIAPSLAPSGLWSEEMGVIKRQCLALRVWGEQLRQPQLTCREMSSTSHSSSHSWVTADMATTVDTRMATSAIWKGESQQTGAQSRGGWTARRSPVCLRGEQR